MTDYMTTSATTPYSQFDEAEVLKKLGKRKAGAIFAKRPTRILHCSARKWNSRPYLHL